MTQIIHPHTGEYLWRCPECGETIRLSSQAAVCLAEQAGRCQGCRAKATFQQRPELIGFFLDFWARADAWPQSDSWMEEVPLSGVSIVGNGDSRLRRRSTKPDTSTALAA